MVVGRGQDGLRMDGIYCVNCYVLSELLSDKREDLSDFVVI